MGGDLILRKNDRVVFLGDSITEQQLYTNYVETYLAGRYPELKLTFFNAGWGGDTAPGGCLRLERDVLALKPTVVTICYGMNDGQYCPPTEAIRNTFLAGMKELVARLKAAGVRVVLLTPGMVDETVAPHLAAVEYNARGLRILADEVLKLAGAEQLPVGDLHALMNEVDRKGKAADMKFCMIPDAVHPDPAGHLVMAFGLLQALGVPPSREELTVEVAGARATASGGLRLRRVKRAMHGVDLALQLHRVPFFVEHQARKVLPFLPFLETFNNLRLVVKGLPAGNGYVRARNFRSAMLPASAFEAGVGFHDLCGGAIQASVSALRFTMAKDALYFRLWRSIGVEATPGWADMAVRMVPAMDRARERLMGRPALTLDFSILASDRPGEPVTNGDFIGRWSFLGPFPAPYTDDKLGGEAVFSSKMPVLSGEWTVREPDLTSVMTNNLGLLFGECPNSFLYALTTLDSPVDQQAELLLGSDDGFALWLNGECLASRLEICRGVVPDSDAFPVRLRKGRNVLLVKISQAGGGWGFCVRFRGLQSSLSALRAGEEG